MAITTQQRTDLIEMYVAIAGRAPDADGLAFWATALEGGKTLAFIAQQMWDSAPTQALYPASLTVEETVTAIYENVLGREPDAQGLAFWVARWNANGNNNEGKTLLEMIDAINNYAGTDPAALASKQLFQDKVAFGEWFALTLKSNDLDLAQLGFDVLQDGGSIADAQAAVQKDPDETVILTGSTDVETTGSGDDTFLATEQTLDTSDDLDGGAGYDVLEVSVEDENYFFTAPEISNIELITVTGGGSSFTAGTIDLSDAEGYTMLELKENEYLDFEWADIQDVVDVDLRIEDTNHGWVEYDYDTNAYLTLGGGNDDIVDLEVAEVDCLEITFGNETPNNSPSHVDQINLTSSNVAGINNPSLFNYIWDLNVGPYFDTLIVDGNTHLEIEEFLDPSVTLVDSTALTSSTGLFIDMYGQGAVHQNADLSLTLSEEITVRTGVGADRIDVAAGEDNYLDGVNGTYTLGAGADTLRVGVVNDGGWYMGEDECYTEPTYMVDCNGIAGNQEVDSGAGDDYIDIHARGEHTIVTAAGADWVHVGGDADDLLTSPSADGLTTIDTGTENDYVWVEGDGDFSVTLGTGADTLYLEGCGEDFAEGDSTVSGGDGDDYISMYAVGYQVVDAGAGADTAHIGTNCDGDLGEVSVTMGTGDDQLYLYGSSFDTSDANSTVDVDIDLGAGNDYFSWQGESGSLTAANAVVFNAGTGDDTAVFTGDHRFDLDMGTGADVLEMNADHLESQDTIDMGDGVDTIILHNGDNADLCDFGEDCGTTSNGTVRDSETSNTRSVEVFDLRNGNITLELTTGLFQTAEDNFITVITEESEFVELPPLTLLNDDEDEDDDQTVFVFSEGMSREDWDSIVEDWEDGLYVEAYSYGFAETDLLEYLFDNGIEAVDFHDENDDGDDMLYTPEDLDDSVINGDDDDAVFFRTETCEQTIDVTAVDFSLVPGWSFELKGGNVRDIIIANDDFVAGNYILRFDSAGGDAESVTDTLVIIGDADVTNMDEEQITGLECIILQGDDLNDDVWEIDLTEAFVNQTTGSADLEIFVDTNVPAGSELRLYTDDIGNPSNNVVIHSNSNVTVYIDDVAVTAGSYLGGLITVQSQLLFTTNADTLLGGSGNDIFYADSLSQVQDADSVDGGEGTDELRFGFGVYNQDEDLEDLLDDDLDHWENVEIIKFVLPGADSKTIGDIRTNQNIAMEGIGFLVGEGLEELHTGTGDDWLGEMEGGIEYHVYEGDDYVEIDGPFEDYGATVFAGDGDDTVYGGEGDDSIVGAAGEDDLYGGEGEDTISGGDNEDYISGGEDDDDLYGGNANDTIYGGEGDDYIEGNDGNDTIDGGSGNDDIYGGAGNDYIEGEDGHDYIEGNDGNDDIYGGSGNDTIYGGSGNDDLYGGSGSDTIHGGNGNDYIDSDNGAALITGGAGNDTINADDSSDLLNIDAGTGVDQVTINWLSGSDTIGGGSDADLDYLRIDSEDDLDDDEFTNVTGFDVLYLTGDDSKTMNVGDEFEESGITSIYSGSGNDYLNFGPTAGYGSVSNATDLYISTDGGADSVEGGLGDDTIEAGNGADTVVGNAGADDIDLGLNDDDSDVVVFTRGDDGALTGQESGYDTVRNFDVDDDFVRITGNLATAVVDGGGFVPDTDNFSLDISGSAVELAVYTDTGLTDADLTDLDTMMDYLNNFLAIAEAGDDMLYLVQGTTDTAMYYYVENTGDNVIDASEIRILSVFDNALLDDGNVGV